MEKRLFTSESVTEGHPDKICDAISDAILDALLEQDPMSRVACEAASCTGFVLVTGEITTNEPVQLAVSQATRLIGSFSISASRIASEMASHILSGCPSVTDSEVNKRFSICSSLDVCCEK